MQIAQYASSVQRRLIAKHADNIIDTDIKQVLEICQLLDKDIDDSSPVAYFDSPSFSPTVIKYGSIDELFKDNNFVDKYEFFVKLMYTFLKLGIPLFDKINGKLIIKNNRRLVRSVIATKKKLLSDHARFIHSQYKKAEEDLSKDYDMIEDSFSSKVKLLDGMKNTLIHSIDKGVIKAENNPMSIILEYFYVYENVLEVFG